MLAIVAALFIAAGFAGLFLGTFGGALAAGFWTSLRGPRRGIDSHAPSASLPLRVNALVAAYNEEASIVGTLRSLADAADALSAARPGELAFSITVGLDHCTDGTAAAVEEFAAGCAWPVRRLENDGPRGKWNMLRALVARAQGADWVALVDAGSIWDSALLEAAWPNLRDGAVVGVAPSYMPSRCGSLERANWKLEQLVKSLEARAGGPVSVHGASVLYRREPAQRVFESLGDTAWFNDDVVLPLSLRLANPGSRIAYLAAGRDGWVRDLGVSGKLDVELRRRRRMVVGNLQWVKCILLPHLGDDLAVTLVASRRVFRLFWAYWVLFVGFGTAIAIVALPSGLSASSVAALAALSLGALALVALRSNWVGRLAMAFVSGLGVPRYWKELAESRGVSWV